MAEEVRELSEEAMALYKIAFEWFMFGRGSELIQKSIDEAPPHFIDYYKRKLRG